MIRVHFYIEEFKLKILKNLKGKTSEHIRRAIDEYIEELEKNRYSASQSKEVKDEISN